MENFPNCSKAVLQEVRLAENTGSPSVDWDTQNSLKNCTFNQLAFRLDDCLTIGDDTVYSMLP